MSDATERPADRQAEPDADAWATACAEDLASEKARRRTGSGPEPGSAAEELRKLAEAVTDKLAGIQLPGALGGIAAQGAVNQLFKQAKAAVEPVIERNPDIFDHLAAAGSELLAAYRSAVEGSERRWTRDDLDDRSEGRRDDDPRDDDGPTGTERIDLD
ncbi:DUF5304 domain-containing protein [Streptomyces libani]|uniref:DUF5304 domain-containing protein n=2 Tax=Streptomyces nigrescens TaxID=1920 RepID=A0A640TQY0_STRNI|nr:MULTISPECIES: DUF5304 domain-containing protein [Streptomyces]MCW7989135.1 hypothetical protein [Streptomyces platensis subsp. clarensis]AWN26808.1 hypothetical protein DKG71_12330 [Streptomyces sp. NEAU-S7GS2]MCR8579027.1 DUF5304 domain-containing protein [Streptomyces sp. Isolate_219]MCX5450910.1 DUF5304 domain-containing protein [Streptomyces libani]MYT17630.1 hypothetical protein [Streptomyces sp. SID4951]